jgi:hypothetical protein
MNNSDLELFLNVERVEEAAGEGDGILGGVHSVDPARRHEECVSCTNPSVVTNISLGTSSNLIPETKREFSTFKISNFKGAS